MKRILFLLFFIVALYGMNAQQNITQSINNFSFKILEQLHSGKENCIYSPYSVFTALSMTYAGTKKDTKHEFENVLGFDSKEKLHEELKQISDAAAIEREYTLLSSNSIWLKEGLDTEKNFIGLLEDQYKAGVKKVNFADEKEREKARIQINELIETQTKGNIIDFLQKGLLDESAAMVLINAVYFSAVWKTEFAPENIKTENFKIPSGDSIACSMMNTSLETGYFEDDKLQVVELPYQNSKASMLVFLPKEGVNLDYKNFNYSYLQQILNSLSSKLINLGLPKFSLETNYELSDGLKKMGLKTAFSPEGNFSGISGSEKLFIDKVLHKSKLVVNEKGTEASSATAVISMRSTKIAQDPIQFKANRPFFFIIRENQNKLILFTGFIANPGKS